MRFQSCDLRIRFSLICGLMASIGVLSSVQAQQANPDTASGAQVSQTATEGDSSSQLQEIVVTSTRNAEPINKVPISVVAFSQATLDKLSVRSADDVMALTPGVDFSRGVEGFGLNTTIDIRGIGSTVGSATTGIYIDDTPIQTRTLLYSSGNFWPVMFDLDRVEVLRGPQGTLFGAASEGGTVRFITPEPSLKEYSGYTRTEGAVTQGAGDPSYEAGAAFGGPIVSDVLGFRVSAYYRHDGGFIDRVRFGSTDPSDYQRDTNSLNSTALRAALKWAPVSGLTISPSMFIQEQFLNDGPFVWSDLSNESGRHYVSGDAQNSTTHDRFTLSALDIKWDAGPVTLYANSSYFDRKNHSLFDYTEFELSYFGDGNPADYFSIPGYYATSPQLNTQQNFTQEVRVQSADQSARLTWVAGLYYNRSKQSAKELDNDPFFGDYYGLSIEQLFGEPLLNGETIYLDDFQDVDTEKAVFGSVSFAVTSKLKLTAGVRASHTGFSFAEYKDGPASGGYSASSGSAQESPVNPRYAASYQINDDNMVYVSAAKGYRVGGANAQIPGYAACQEALASLGLKSAPLTYKSDSTWSYELGSKNRLEGGRLQLNGSIYYIQWNGIIEDTLATPNCPFTFTTNLGKAMSRGFDISAQWQVFDQLVAGVSVGFNNSQYTQTIRSAGATQDIVTAGHILGATPWTIDGTAEYRIPGLIGREAYVTAISEYHSNITGKTDFNDPNYSTYDPLIHNPRSTLNVDLRAGARFDSGWDISLFADNLLNRANVIQATRDATTAQIFHYDPARPRTIGVTVSERF